MKGEKEEENIGGEKRTQEEREERRT